jgi:hypothetical protein
MAEEPKDTQKKASPPKAPKLKAPTPPALSRLSVSGLDTIDGGLVFDTTIRDLKGPRSFLRFREMADHSPVIGGSLFAIESLLRKVRWKVDPGDGSAEEKKHAEVFTSMMDDMEMSWEDTVTEILSFLPFGFAPVEKVFKIRRGPNERDRRHRSKHSDGLVAWRKWALIPQETVSGWNWDDEGNPTHVLQQGPPDYKEHAIPYSKLLNFRTKAARGNPQGRSLLVTAYYAWNFVKRIQEFEAIGIERDLAGVPMAEVPPEILSPDATPDDKNMLEAIKKIVTGVRVNSQGGVIWPKIVDDENNVLTEFKLLTTGGMKQMDTNKIVERYERRMAMSLLTDILLMGHERVGSLALSRDKTTLIGRALAGILGAIAAQINRVAVPEIYALNGWPTEAMCQFKPGDIENADLKTLGGYLANLGRVGLVTPDPTLENELRQLAGLPDVDPEYVRGPDDLPTGGAPVGDNPDDDDPDPDDPDPDKKKPTAKAFEALVRAARRK